MNLSFIIKASTSFLFCDYFCGTSYFPECLFSIVIPKAIKFPEEETRIYWKLHIGTFG